MALTLLILFLSASLTIIIIPFARVTSTRLGMMSDSVNEFRTNENIPWLGGLPFLFTLLMMVVVGIKLSRGLVLSESGILLIILIGGFLIFLVGLFYDLKMISPWIALFGQLIVAIILVFSEITFIHGNQLFGYVLSAFYLVGTINAFKLLDDADGLATGMAGIAAFFFGVIFYLQNNLFGMLIAGIILGSTIAFIYYNFHPARILLGSNGNYFLGLFVGIMAILVGKNELTVRTSVVPLVILAIPILDTLSVLLQSLIKRQSIFSRTGVHIYGIFANKKLTLNQTVILFYAVGIALGVTAIWLFRFLS